MKTSEEKEHKFYMQKKRFGIRADCPNIFDKQYEIVKNYPMPGRTFRLTISTEL